MWHREMKALQIMVFVYIGAASGNWGPGNIRDLGPEVGDGGDEARVWVEHGELHRSLLFAFPDNTVSMMGWLLCQLPLPLSRHLTGTCQSALM